MLLSTGGEFGGRDASRIVDPFFSNFGQAIDAGQNVKPFKNLESLTIIWRVAGEFGDFDGKEGPGVPDQEGEKGFLGNDLYIPINAWKDARPEEFSRYLIAQHRKCFELMLDWCRDHDELVDENAAKTEFEEILKRFEQLCYEIK